MSVKEEYLSGLKAAVPVMLGFVPVGIAYAIMAAEAGFNAFETVFMSLAVFAGAAQMMSVGMYAGGAGAAAIILTTFILNLRHLIMSTCVVNRMKRVKVPLKLLAAYGVTDESFAIFTTLREEKCSVVFFLGLITGTYSSWVAGSAIGAAASGLLPPIISESLAIALYAMFIGLLVPNITRNLKLAVLVLFTALVNYVLSGFMSSAWALIAATLFCAFIGVYFVDSDTDGNGACAEKGAENED